MNLRMLFFSFILLVIVMALGSYILSHAYFTDTAVLASNTFTTAESFGTPTPTGDVTPTIIPTVTTEPTPGKIVINEIAMDGDNNRERVELYNAGGQSVDVSGWTITDANSTDSIPTNTLAIPSGGYLIIVTNNTIVDTSSINYVVLLSPTIGDGLADAGEALILKNGTQEVDSISYGTNTIVFNPSVTAPVVTNETLRRIPNGMDTDTAADWQIGAASMGVSN